MSKEKAMVIDDMKFTIDYKTCGMTEEEADKMFSPDTLLDLDEVLANKNCWHAMYQHCIWFMMHAVPKEHLRFRKIFIYRSHDRSFEIMQISVIKFTINMILMYPLVALDSVDLLTNSMIITEPYAFTQQFLKDYVNNIVCDAEDVSKAEKSYILDTMFYHISSISFAFDDILGLGISIRAFYDIDKQSNGKLNQILHDQVDPKLQPKDIETAIADHVKTIVDIITNSNSELTTMFASGNMISKGQLGEVMVAVGFKSDLDGNTIPIPSLNNILITGINNAIDKFIDSVGGRKAGINSKIGISVPGANAKKEIAAASDFTLRPDNIMCDSTTTLPVLIKDEKYLEGMNSHYYYDDNGDLKLLNRKTDKHLIGKTIRFRSVITCNCRDGSICRYCYPKKLTESNENVASIGAYAATVMSEPLGQMVLSTKHFNGTNSNHIEFPEEFNNDFELIMSDICLKNSESDASYIRIEGIYKDGSDDDSTEYVCNSFDVLGKNGEFMYNVADANGARMYLIDQLDAIIKTKKPADRTSLTIDFDSIDQESPLFMVEVASTQTMNTAKQIRKLTCTKEKCGCTTYLELFEKLVEAYLSAGILMNFAHIEMIVKSLMRKDSDLYDLPDFGPNGDPTDYRLLSLNDVLYHSLSPLTCLRTSNLKRQLVESMLYTANKTRPSHQDVIFADTPYDVIPDEYKSIEE